MKVEYAVREKRIRVKKVKLLRANGGCLGGGRRRRTCQAAISFGELSRSVDPEISEWGNPAGVISSHPALIYYMKSDINRVIYKGGRRTRGSETSQYPEEKKVITIL